MCGRAACMRWKRTAEGLKSSSEICLAYSSLPLTMELYARSSFISQVYRRDDLELPYRHYANNCS
jgi:hypothetical protein